MSEEVLQEYIPLAQYRSQEVSEFCGNPLIEALPPILDDAALARHMMILPSYSPDERGAPPHLRRYFAERLYDAFVPLPFHVHFAETVGRVLRQGYKARDPLRPNFVQHKHFQAFQNSDGIPPPQSYRTSSSAMLLTGLSGIGKSSLLRSALTMYPQAIRHISYRDAPFTQAQVVWLKIDCPPDGSLKGLCFSFLHAIDRALQTDIYFKMHAKSRSSADQLLETVQRLALTHHVGLLVVDELQHLRSARTGNAKILLNFLVNLINNIGVPIVVTGTYAILDLFKGALRDARRVSAQGIMALDRLAAEDRRWRFLVEGLWRYQWTADVAPLSDEIVFVLHGLTQGVTDVLVKLLVMTQQEAIRQNIPRIDCALLKQTMTTRLVLLEPALAALRKGGKHAYAQYEDLKPTHEQVLDNLSEAEPCIGLDELAAQLGEAGQAREHAPAKVLGEKFEGGNSLDETAAEGSANFSFSAVETDRLATQDLRQYVKGPDAYSALLDAGYILDDPLLLNQKI